MRATRIKIESLIVKIAQTRDIEATCDDCARLSAKLADVLLASRVEDEQLLAILHHLQECVPCAEEFQVLRDCARMEHEGSWPPLEEIWQKLDGAP